MAGKPTKHAAFRDFLTGQTQPQLAKLTVVVGCAEMLAHEAIAGLRRQAAAADLQQTAVEAPSLSDAAFLGLCRQSSLFEPGTFYLLRRCEAAKALPKLFSQIKKTADLQNPLCLVVQADAPAAPLAAELRRLKAHVIPCHQPWPNELPQVLGHLARGLGLQLRPDALRLLAEVNGDDLVKQHNELRKLALVTGASATGTGGADATGAGTALTAAMIAPHLGLLREDEAFLLDRLLLDKQWAKAQALATSLGQRGEKGLALLAILAGHCRSVLRLGDAIARGLGPAAIASETRLPPLILKLYLPVFNRPSDLRPYRRALALCQAGDRLLKSTPISEDLLIARVIDAMSTV